MLNHRRLILFILASLVFSACASGVRTVTDPHLPLERPSYSVLPPPGDGWRYMSQEQVGRFDLSFGKRSSSPTHTWVATVTETHSLASFRDPAEFLKFVQQSAKAGTDPRRFTLVAAKFELDNRFGAYSVRKVAEAEDRAAVNARGEPFLVLRILGQVFVHPHFGNLIISIDYSERGKRDELDPTFEASANQFLDGLRLKRP